MKRETTGPLSHALNELGGQTLIDLLLAKGIRLISRSLFECECMAFAAATSAQRRSLLATLDRGGSAFANLFRDAQRILSRCSVVV